MMGWFRYCGAKQHFWMRRGQVIRSLCGMQLAWLATEPELEGVKCKRCMERSHEEPRL